MSYLKTNTNKGDARERTKNLENITIMSAANKSLDTNNQNLKTNVATFKDNKLQSTNNHSNLLKITHGYFDLEPCCDLIKQKATSLEDGLQTQINANSRITLAQSSCNRQPLFDSNNCNTPSKNMRPNVPKSNFKYPMPLQKNSCCSQKRIQPKIKINSSKTHTKYLPVMSKIKTFNYNQTQEFDPVSCLTLILLIKTILWVILIMMFIKYSLVLLQQVSNTVLLSLFNQIHIKQM